MLHREISSESARQRLLAGLPLRERRVNVAGVSTVVLEGGEGSPVVLLHGPGAHALAWMRVIPGLVGRYRVMVPDLPAHGESAPLDGELEVSRMMAWVAELVERTCARPPAAGRSSDRWLDRGALRRRTAEQGRQARARQQHGIGRARPTARVRHGHQPVLHGAKSCLTRAALAALRPRSRRSEAPDGGDLERFRRVQHRGRQFLRPRSKRAEAASSCSPGNRWSRRCSSASRAPVTLVWGRHDRATPLAVAEAASKRYHWPLRIIEGANDDPPVEQPEALVLVLRAVLSGVS